MNRIARWLGIAIALASAPLSAGLLVACEQPACDAGRDVYETMLAPVTITAGTTLRVPMVLLTAEPPTQATFVSFQIPNGCDGVLSRGSLGTFRILDADGNAIDGTTSMARTMNAWCTPNAFGTGEPVPALPARLFTCDSVNCRASVIVEMVPVESVRATELEAELRDVSTSCTGEAPIPTQFRAHFEQFGE